MPIYRTNQLTKLGSVLTLPKPAMSIHSPLTHILLLACALLGACRKDVRREMPHRAYVWQRQWTPAVAEAAAKADRSPLSGLALFGA